MLFAVKYEPKAGRTREESRRLNHLIMKWQPPPEIAVQQHYHYVSGGGVMILDANQPGDLFEALEPFKSMVIFDVEPVINFLEAVAVAQDITEWEESLATT